MVEASPCYYSRARIATGTKQVLSEAGQLLQPSSGAPHPPQLFRNSCQSGATAEIPYPGNHCPDLSAAHAADRRLHLSCHAFIEARKWGLCEIDPPWPPRERAVCSDDGHEGRQHNSPITTIAASPAKSASTTPAAGLEVTAPRCGDGPYSKSHSWSMYESEPMAHQSMRAPSRNGDGYSEARSDTFTTSLSPIYNRSEAAMSGAGMENVIAERGLPAQSLSSLAAASNAPPTPPDMKESHARRQTEDVCACQCGTIVRSMVIDRARLEDIGKNVTQLDAHAIAPHAVQVPALPQGTAAEPNYRADAHDRCATVNDAVLATQWREDQRGSATCYVHHDAGSHVGNKSVMQLEGIEDLRRELNKTQALWKGCEARLRDQPALFEDAGLVTTQHSPGSSEVQPDAPVQQFVGRPSGTSAPTVQSAPAQALLALIAMTLRSRLRDKEMTELERTLRERGEALLLQQAAMTAAEGVVEMLSMQLEEKDADNIALEMSLVHARGSAEEHTRKLSEVNEDLRRDLSMRMSELRDNASEIQQLRYALTAANGRITELQGRLKAMIGEAQQSELEMHKLSTRTPDLTDGCGMLQDQPADFGDLLHAFTAAKATNAQLHGDLGRASLAGQQTELRLREQHEALVAQQVATVAYEDDVEMLSMLLEEKEVDCIALEMSLEHASAGADGRTQELSETIGDLRLELSMKAVALTDTSGKLRERGHEVEQLRQALTAAQDAHTELQKDLDRATSEGKQTEHRLREQHDAVVAQHRVAAMAAEELVEMLSLQLEEKEADTIALEKSLEHAGAAVEDRTQELREVSEELSIRAWALADADGRQREQAGEVEQLRDALTAAKGMHAQLQEKLERLTLEAQQTELRLREQHEALVAQQVATVAYEDDVEMLSMLLEEKEVDYIALEISLEHASAGADGRTQELSETIGDLRLELSMKAVALTDTSGKLREREHEVEQLRQALTAAQDAHTELQKDLDRATSEGKQTEHRLREQHDAVVAQHRVTAMAAEELVEMLSLQLEEKEADTIALEMSLEHAGAAVEDRTQELREVSEELSIRAWALADADGRQREQAGEVEQLRDALTAAKGMHAQLQEKLERLTLEAQQTELRLREQHEALVAQQVATVAYEDDVEMLSMLLEEKEVDYIALEISLEHASAGADGRTQELSETIGDLRLELSMKAVALTDTSGKLREREHEVEQLRQALTAAQDAHTELQKDLDRATSEGKQTEHRLREQHDAVVVQHWVAAMAAEELVEMLSLQLEEKEADTIALEMSLEHAGAAVEDRTQELREVSEELSIRAWALADADGRQREQAGEVEQLRDALTAAKGMHAQLQEKLERLTLEAQQTELRLREQHEALVAQQVATVAYEDDVEMLSMLLEEKEVDYIALEISLEHASAGADGRTQELSETIGDLRLELSMKAVALTDTSGKLRERGHEVEQLRQALTAAQDAHTELQKDLDRATSEGKQTEDRLREQHDAVVAQHRVAAMAAEELVEMLSLQLEEKEADTIALEMSLEQAGAAVEDRTQELREVSEELSIKAWALADADGRQREQEGEVEQLRDALTAAKGMHAQLQEKLERLTLEAQQTELRLREQHEALVAQQVATVAYEDDVEMLSMLLEEKEVDYIALEISLEHASAGADGRTQELSGTIGDLRLELSMKAVALTDTSGKLRERGHEVEQLRQALTAAQDAHTELQKDLDRATSEGKQTEHSLREQHDAVVVQHWVAAMAAEELVEMLSLQLEEKEADTIALEMSLEHAGAAVEDRTQELREVSEELSIRAWALADADGRQREQAGEVEQLRDALTAAKGMHAQLQEKLERLTLEAQQTELRLREQHEALVAQQVATVAYEDDVEMLSMLLEEKEVDYIALEISLEHASAGADGRTQELSETIGDLRLELSMKAVALTDTSGKLREREHEVEQLRQALTAAQDAHTELQKDLDRATSEGKQTEHRLREQHDAVVVQHGVAAMAAEELVEMLSLQLEEKEADTIALEMSLEQAGAAVEDRTQELREVSEELSIRAWALADADGRQREQAGEVEQLRDALTAAKGMHAQLQEKLERLTLEAQQTELRLREQHEALVAQQVATVAYEDDVEMLSMLLEEKEVDYIALEMSLEHASAGADGRAQELSEIIGDLRLELSMKAVALTDTSGKLRERGHEVEQLRQALTAAQDAHTELQKDLDRATSEGKQTVHRLREQHDAVVAQHRVAAMAAEELVEMLSLQLEEKEADTIALEMSREHAGAAVEDRTQELREVSEELSIRAWALADADGRQREQAGEVEQLRDALTAAKGMHAQLQEKLERLTLEAQQTELRLREQHEALVAQQVATVAYEDDVEMLSMLLEEKEVDYIALEISLEHASAGADGRTQELSETIGDLRLELSMKAVALTDTSGKLRERGHEVEQLRQALTAAQDAHTELQKDLDRATSEGKQTEHSLREQHDAVVVQHWVAAMAAEELVEMLSLQLEEKEADTIALEMSLEHAGAAVEDRTQELREVSEELSIRAWALADADGRQREQAGEVEQLRDALTAAKGMHAQLQEKLERLTLEAQQTELRLREQHEALVAQQVATVAYEDDVEMLSMLLEEKEVDYIALEMSLEHASAGADGRTQELSGTIGDLRLELSMKAVALTDTSGKLRERGHEVEQLRQALTAAQDAHTELQKDLDRATSEGKQTEHRLREQHDAVVVQHGVAAMAAEELVEMLSLQLEEKEADTIALEMSLEQAGAAVEDRTQELREVSEELSIRAWALADADGRQREQAGEVEQLRDALTAAKGMHAQLQEKLERLTLEAQQTELRLREQHEALVAQQVATVAYEDDVEMLSMLLEEKEVDYIALEMSLEHASAGADGRAQELSEIIGDLRLELSMKAVALTDTSGKLRERGHEVEQLRQALTAAQDAHTELQKDLDRATSEGKQTVHRLREQHDAVVAQHRVAAMAAEELVEMLSLQLEEKEADTIALEMSREHAGAAVEDRTQELREVSEELSIRAWALADADGRQREQAGEVEQLRDALTAAKGMHAQLQEKLERLTLEAQQTELRLREQHEALVAQQVATVAYEDDVEMLSMLLEEKEVDYIALEISLEHASAGADGRTQELSETIGDLRLELSMKAVALTDTSGKLRERGHEVEQLRQALTAAQDAHTELQKDLDRATSEGKQTVHRLREQHDAVVAQHRVAAMAAEELVEMLSLQLEEKEADTIALEMSLEHAGAAVEDRTQELREVSEELSIRAWALADADGRQREQAGEVEQLRDALTAAKGMHAQLQEKLERLTLEAQQTELRLREQHEALVAQQVATVAYEDDVEMLSMLLEEKEVDYIALEISLEHASAGADGRAQELSETIGDLRLELSMKAVALTDTSGKLRERGHEVEQLRQALTAAQDAHTELQKDLDRATSEGKQTEHRLREQHDAVVAQHRVAAMAAEELVEMLSLQLEEKEADTIALEMSREHAGAAVEDRTQELREVSEELSIRAWALADADGRQREQAGEVEQLRDALTAAKGMHAQLQEKLERLTLEAQQTELRPREQHEALVAQQVATVAYEDDVEMLSMLLEEKEVDYIALEMSLEHASAGADGRTQELSETIGDLRLELSMKAVELTDTSGKLRERGHEVEQLRQALTAAQDAHTELQKDLDRATSEGKQTEHRLREQHDAVVAQHRVAAMAAEELVEMLSLQLEEKEADTIALEMSREHAGAAVEDRTQELREVSEELSIRAWALADADGRQREQAGEVEQLRDALTAAKGMHAQLQEKLERLTLEAQQTELRPREQHEALVAQQVATVAYEDDVEMLSMLLEEKEVDYIALEISLEHASAGADGRTQELSETIGDLRLELSMKAVALTDTSGKLRERGHEVEQLRQALTAAQDAHTELQKDLDRATSEGKQTEHRLREQHDAVVAQHWVAAMAAEELVEMLSLQLEEKEADTIALEMSLEQAGAAVEDRTQELREVSEELSIRAWALADADGRQREQAGEVEQLRDALTAAKGMHAQLQEKLERLTLEAQQTELRLREQHEALVAQQVATVAYEDDVEMLSMLLEEKEVDYIALEMSLEHASAGADGRTQELSETIGDLRLELSMKAVALTDTSGKLRERGHEVEQLRQALTAAQDAHTELQKDLDRATSEGKQTEHRLREQHDAVVAQHWVAAMAAEELVEMLSLQLEEKEADTIALEMSREQAGAAVEDRTQELREVSEELSIRAWALADADGRQREQAGEVEQLRDALTAAKGMHAQLQEKLERLTLEAQQTELRLREQHEALVAQQVATVAYEDDVEMLSMLLEEKEVDYIALEMSLEHASAGADGRTQELSETIGDLRLELSMKAVALTDTSGKLRERGHEVEQLRQALTAACDTIAELQRKLETMSLDAHQTEHSLREHQQKVADLHAAVAADEAAVEMLQMQLKEKEADKIVMETILEHTGEAAKSHAQELREVSEELELQLGMQTAALAKAISKSRGQEAEIDDLQHALRAGTSMIAQLQEDLKTTILDAQQKELKLREQHEAVLGQQAATEAAEGLVRLLRMQLEEKEADHRSVLHLLDLARNTSDGLNGKLSVASEELTNKTRALREQANEIEQLRHALAAAEDKKGKLQYDANLATAEAQQTKLRLLEQQEALAKVHAALTAHEENVEMLHMELEEKEADIIAFEMMRQHADDGAECHVEELSVDNEILRLGLSMQTNGLAEVNSKLRGHEADNSQLRHLLTAANSMLAQLQGDLEMTRLDTRQTQLKLHEQHEALIVQQAATAAAEGLLEALRIQLQKKEADHVSLEHLLAHANNATDGLSRELDIVTEDLRIKTLALSEHASETEQLRHALGAAEDRTGKLQAELKSANEEVQQTKLRLREQQETVAELEAAMTAHHGCVETLRTQLEKKAASNTALEQSLRQAYDAADDLRQQLSVINEEVRLRVSSLEEWAVEVQHLRQAVAAAHDTRILLQGGREGITVEAQQMELMLREQHETLAQQHAATQAAEKLVEMLRMQLEEKGAGHKLGRADEGRSISETELGHTDCDDARLSYCKLETDAARSRLRTHRRLHGLEAATVAASDTKEGRKSVAAPEGLCRVHNAESELVRRTDQCDDALERELAFLDTPDTKVDRVQDGDEMLYPALTRVQPQSGDVLSVSLDSKSGDPNQPGAVGSQFPRTVEGDEHRSPTAGKVVSMTGVRATVTSRTAARPITHAAQDGPVGQPAGMESEDEGAGQSGAYVPSTLGRDADRHFTEDGLVKAHPSAVENPHSIGEARPNECDSQPFESMSDIGGRADREEPAAACHAHHQPDTKDAWGPSTKQAALDSEKERKAADDTLSRASIHGRTQAEHVNATAAALADATEASNIRHPGYQDTYAAPGAIESPHGGQHEKEPPVRTGSAHSLLRLLAKQLQDFTDSFSTNENTRQ